jgi:hypothetical protein
MKVMGRGALEERSAQNRGLDLPVDGILTSAAARVYDVFMGWLGNE